LLREKGLKTEADVYALLQWLKGPIVSTKRICNNPEHTAPFKFVADILLDRVRDYIVWANRSGSKSYLAGLITWVRSSFNPKVETTILGGSFEQSEKSYKAMMDFWKSTGLQDAYLAVEPRKSEMLWKNGSLVSVLTASTKSTRGPHSQKLILDEIDEMDDEVYKAALSIPQSKFDIKASIGKLSTNHKTGGVMDNALEKATNGGGIKIYKWCVFDAIESCKDYSCSTCKLSPYCPGKQMKTANGYYKIEDFIQKLYELSDMTLQVEWLSNKVGRDDLVYGAQYDKMIHSPLDLPGFNPSKPVYLSIDWGGTNPFSVGVWQKFPIGWVRVDEVYIGNTTNKRVMKECKVRPWWKKIKEGVADPARADLRREWDDIGVSLYRGDTDVDEGIEAVRDALAPVLGNPLFYVNRKCKAWIREVGSYSEKNGVPIKENDHTCDETKYFVRRYIKKKREPGVRRVA